MARSLLSLLLLALLAGCMGQEAAVPPSTALEPLPAGAVSRSGPVTPTPPGRIAALPDRGELVSFERGAVRRDGAYAWHRATLSEAHARRTAAEGMLRLATPEGRLLDIRYDRHIEHASGDWTWIGHLDGDEGAQTIITFGRDAVFGSIAQRDGLPLRLTVRDGATWLVETDGARVAGIVNAATRPGRPDFLRPPVEPGRPARASGLGPSVSAGPVTTSAATTSAATSTSGTTVDVVLGYTPGFVAANGGTTSAAVTRLNYLVDVANATYRNSQIGAQARLVATVAVNYTDDTTNASTLEKLTGYRSGQGAITPDPAFQGLRNARQTYGADLVSLARRFKDPEQDGCGIAWLIGGGQSGISASDASFGYSIFSDGQDAGTDGKTYYCRDETLAHEMGHNMGSAHDRETAKDDDGVLDPDDYGLYPYSFGYKNIAANFYTVMAYGDTGQKGYRVFSNPAISFCGGAVCGISNQADNASSLRQAIPVVATFRATVVPLGSTIAVLDLVAIHRNAALATEVLVASRASNYKTQTARTSTALGPTGSNGAWAFAMGDHDGDGVLDLYAVKKNGASGRTEVTILSGADGFRSVLLQKATALGVTGTDQRWMFKLGDYNRDGRNDLYAIYRMGASGTTEFHVLNGADGFATFLAHRASALGITGSGYTWKFELADYNRDGILDVHAIAKMGGSGRTEVHVLDGASGFKQFLLRTATVLGQSGADNSWDFKLGDYNRDGITDVYAIAKMGASGMTELHVMDGATRFASYATHVATVLPRTGTDAGWEFEIARTR